MPRGTFLQSAAILLSGPVSLDAIEKALGGRETRRVTERAQDARWMSGDRGLAVDAVPGSPGVVVVNALDCPWPDDMGDPQEETMLFGAWTMGFFGPFTYPGALERATTMADAFTWQGARQAVDEHAGVLRISSSYVAGKPEDTPLYPEDYDPLADFLAVTDVASDLLALPEALAYFNPNGETILDAADLRESLDYHAGHDLPPLPAVSAIRLFRPDGAEGWCLMDTVGMEQLDVDDMEACYPGERYDGNEVSLFLRNVSEYVRESGPVIQHGDTVDGPGDLRWQAFHTTESLVPRPRTTLRWFPQDGSTPPDVLCDGLLDPAEDEPPEPEPKSKKGLFGFLKRVK